MITHPLTYFLDPVFMQEFFRTQVEPYLVINGGTLKMESKLDSWDAHLSKTYIKGSNLTQSTKNKFEVVGLDLVQQKDGTDQLVLDVKYEGKQYNFGLNKTNASKLNKFTKSPKELVGKFVWVNKVLVNNPGGQEVPGIRVEKVTPSGVVEEKVN